LPGVAHSAAFDFPVGAALPAACRIKLATDGEFTSAYTPEKRFVARPLPKLTIPVWRNPPSFAPVPDGSEFVRCYSAYVVTPRTLLPR
jgi:hypothetical protein